MITNTGLNELKDIMAYLDKVPYCVTRRSLYTAAELYEGFQRGKESSYGSCFDGRVYQYYQYTGSQEPSVEESLARSLHDNGVHMALRHFFEEHDSRRCVGVMGGHAVPRTDKIYSEVARLSKRLTEEGFFMVSGGGPGAMEATHLGAWMAGRTDEEAQEAVSSLAAAAESYQNWQWLPSAMKVKARYQQTEYVSLGIPTWLYGHEPSTPFATHIAKYFTNSVREDTILTVAFGGIIYTPGSAGTLQEIFQNAVQEHYLSYGFSSPMVFMGKEFWTEDVPAYKLIQHMVANGRYKNLRLTLTDDPAEVVTVLKDFQKTIPY